MFFFKAGYEGGCSSHGFKINTEEEKCVMFPRLFLKVHRELTLIRQEVQHGLQQEGQVANRQARVAHAAGGVHQFMEEAHLNSSPASVGT